MTKDYKKTKTYKELKQSLLSQLEANGNYKGFFLDLVEDYMKLWIIKNQLIDDIEERGVSVRYNNGGGQYGVKKNENVDQLLKVNSQMLKILTQLEIKAIPTESKAIDDDTL